MKKFFKMLTLMLVVATIAAISVTSLAACGGKAELVVNKFEGLDAEEYAFCVKEGNTALKEQIDAFFADPNVIKQRDISLAYHTGASDKTIEYPNLSDNKGKTITMITEAGFAPYEYSLTEGPGSVNKVGGVDVDMMMLFCEKYDYKMALKDIDFNLIPEEVNNSADYIGAAGMTVTEEREKKVDFAKPYITTVQYIISTKEANIKNMDGLKGKAIGVQDATTGNYIVEDATKTVEEEGTGELVGSGAKAVPYKKVSVAFQNLINGKLDAIVIDEFVAKGLVENYNK